MAARYYLHIPEIVGELKDRDHSGWMDVESFAIERPSSRGGQTAESRESLALEDFHFTKKTDKATPKLMEAAARGLNSPKVTLEVRQIGSAPGAFLPGMRGWLQLKVLTYVFEEVTISSFSIGAGSKGDANPMDTFILNFKKMTYSYS